MARLSVILALVLGFCSSGYDFAIPSSRLYLAVQTLGVAMRFVGNYALRGLSPQTDGMPVIPQKPDKKIQLSGFLSGIAVTTEIPPNTTHYIPEIV